MNKIISKADLIGLRIPMAIMTIVIALFIYTNMTGYRLLDIFGSSEWEREGVSHVSGSHQYFHK